MATAARAPCSGWPSRTLLSSAPIKRAGDVPLHLSCILAFRKLRCSCRNIPMVVTVAIVFMLAPPKSWSPMRQPIPRRCPRRWRSRPQHQIQTHALQQKNQSYVTTRRIAATTAGTTRAVRIALRPMARLAQQPESSHSLNARAVAMPWLSVPSATPRAEGDFTPAKFGIDGPQTAPMMPVTIPRWSRSRDNSCGCGRN